jgi:hypothetical protein
VCKALVASNGMTFMICKEEEERKKNKNKNKKKMYPLLN